MNEKRLAAMVDPRARMLELWVAWVKCRPHQVGKRMLVERSLFHCKRAMRLTRTGGTADGVAGGHSK